MTGRGWTVLGVGAAFWLTGRLLGLRELIQIAIVLSILCLASVMWMRIGRRRIEASRTFSHGWVHRGEEVEISVRIENPDPVPTPSLVVTQKFPGQEPESAYLPPIPPRAEDVLLSSFRPKRRGRFLMEPFQVTLSDPFGLSMHKREFRDQGMLLVYPRVEHLPLPKAAAGRYRGEKTRRIPTPSGEDFYGIRNYETGDDPRRVHWLSTARRGHLMVREDEAGGRQVATIFIDDRESVHGKSEEKFERTVEAAASVVDLYARQSYSLRLVRAGGPGVPLGKGATQYNRIMEVLATITPGRGKAEQFRAIGRGRRDGALIVAAGDLQPDELRILGRAGGGYTEAIVILHPTKGAREVEAAAARTFLSRFGITVISPAEDESLAEAWSRSILGVMWAGSVQ